MNRLNIVYMHSHDTGRYIQPYGYAVPTPALQRFAEQGALFRQAFCVNPTCSPSRACLLTGQYAHVNGMLGLAHRGFSLLDYSHHLVSVLRGHGYRTALAGVQHEANMFDPAWKKIGYDEHLTHPVGAHVGAVEWLAAAPSEPFFLSMGFSETHRVFPEPGPQDNPNYVRPPEPIPDTAETRRDMAGFITLARRLDQKMGAVLDSLDRAGLAERTLVVITTDHGPAFPRMKCNLTDGGIGVMLMMRGPGVPAGHAFDGLVSHLDVFPTLCDLAGLPRPPWLQGVSCLPLFRGDASRIREEIFAEVNYHAAYEPLRAVRTPRWKLIRRYDGRTRPVLPNCDDGPAKSLWMHHGWRDQAPPAEALYDLVFDPQETNNLAGHPAGAEALTSMGERLDRWMRETDDPLLKAPLVPAPDGVIVNDANGVSPQEMAQAWQKLAKRAVE